LRDTLAQKPPRQGDATSEKAQLALSSGAHEMVLLAWGGQMRSGWDAWHAFCSLLSV